MKDTDKDNYDLKKIYANMVKYRYITLKNSVFIGIENTLMLVFI